MYSTDDYNSSFIVFNFDGEPLIHMYGGNKRLIKDSISHILSWEDMVEMEKKNVI